MEGDQTPQLGHAAHGPPCTPEWTLWPFWYFSRFSSHVVCLAKLLLNQRPAHAITPLCVGKHVWIRCATWREAPSPPCPREKGHHALSPFSCMFKCILTDLVQSDCGMKSNVPGIELQIRSSGDVNQHHPTDGHGTALV